MTARFIEGTYPSSVPALRPSGGATADVVALLGETLRCPVLRFHPHPLAGPLRHKHECDRGAAMDAYEVRMRRLEEICRETDDVLDYLLVP